MTRFAKELEDYDQYVMGCILLGTMCGLLNTLDGGVCVCVQSNEEQQCQLDSGHRAARLLHYARRWYGGGVVMCVSSSINIDSHVTV